MKTFSQLRKNLKADFSKLKTVKVALLGDSATQFLAEALRGSGYDRGFNLHLWEADFNQIERQVMDPTSELFEFQPEVVVIFHATHKLLNRYNRLPSDQYHQLADREMELIMTLQETIKSKLRAKIIYYNYPEIDDSVFGNYASKISSSFVFQLRKLNFNLMSFAAEHPDFYICDLAAIQNRVGRNTTFHSSVYVNTEMVLSIEVLPEVASRTLDIIGVSLGQLKKCVVLDLDNTLWGGIIGDDGIENIQVGGLGIGKVFTEFQYWLKKLKNRGIILAVCSKNTESVAMEPFEKHPDMVLRLEDIAVFVANWETKVVNIRHIQSILNIGFDSMVFLDDNPFERNIVRENVPGITIPELPEDPAQYLEYLYSLNLFETVSFSNEDGERTKQYQVEAKRTTLQNSFANEGEFLQSLNMLSLVESFNSFNSPRVAQLSQRSNQFNLRTARYGQDDIERLATESGVSTFSFSLEDKFGDYGIICVIVMKKESEEMVFIDSWFMSCRVLKRGMEDFVLNTIVSAARTMGYKYLKGEYIPTAKNAMVKEHYPKLGFEATSDSNQWILEVDKYEIHKCYIKNK
jgi:FkbH-like protein